MNGSLSIFKYVCLKLKSLKCRILAKLFCYKYL